MRVLGTLGFIPVIIILNLDRFAFAKLFRFSDAER